jgi:hypothetical protein
VVGQTAQQAGGTALRVARQGVSGCQRPRPFLQALDAEELAVPGARIEAEQPRLRSALRAECGVGRRAEREAQR